MHTVYTPNIPHIGGCTYFPILLDILMKEITTALAPDTLNRRQHLMGKHLIKEHICSAKRYYHILLKSSIEISTAYTILTLLCFPDLSKETTVVDCHRASEKKQPLNIK